MYTLAHLDMASNKALNRAIRLAGELGHAQVGTEHLLVSLLSGSVCGGYNQTDPIQEKKLREYLITSQGRGNARQLGPKDLNEELSIFLAGCRQMEDKSGWKRKRVGCQQLLKKLLEGKTAAAKMAGELHLPYGVAGIPQSLLNDARPASTPKGRNLERYGKNLTQMARQNMLDPCIGREEEVKRLIQILCRRQKNNPCLLGEPGVGKTAVVEGLAQRIIRDEVPLPLRYKQVFSLDIASVVAGTKYRGDFEERVRNILDEVINSRGIILFIDEVHTIVGAGAAEGAVDAANILKPLLARGGLQLIGATTPAEYHRSIEKDAALERRFQQIFLEEPNREKTLEILRGLRPKFEEYHRLKIGDDALEAAVDCSVRYIHDRYLPDKAVDLLDEAASACVTQADGLDVMNTVGEKQVLYAAARWAGIPVEELTLTERQKLLGFERAIREELIGQAQATEAVSAAVRRFRMGFSENGRPNGSFLFLGPTGVGKSLLAKILARHLFGSEKLLFRFDMSEYNEPHSVSRLIGAPPGYVGFERSGLLTGTVHRHPYSIVLFDELEKAHPEVLRLLLQILEEGELTDNDGRRVDFRHTLVLATSNLASRQDGWAVGRMGFTAQPQQEYVSPQVSKFLSPELVNRFDEIITFERLDKSALEKIARRELAQLAERLLEKRISLEITDDGCRSLVECCWQPEYGARPLRRGIKSYVEDPLCVALLKMEQLDPAVVILEEEGGRPHLRFVQARADIVCVQ